MEFDLVIVGGGLAGAALAVALRKSRLSVAVVDTAPPLKPATWDTRVYAYSPANATFLQDIGVWEQLDHGRICPVHAMEIFGDRSGALRFGAEESGLGELAWIAESSLVHLELWESLRRQHNVEVFVPARPVRLELGAGGAQLALQDGRTLSARLVVGADGRDSWVREQAGISTQGLAYDEVALVANFACELPHGSRAFQWFREDGTVAWLPLPGNRMSLVWSAPEAVAEELSALTDEAFVDRVAKAGNHALGQLSLLTPRAGFPLRFMRVSSVVGQRIALIGDSAHAIHPLSGHGINLGFQDAKVLSEKLTALKEWEDPGDDFVLRAYARERAEEPCLVQYLTHGINRLFNLRNPLAVAARNLGLNLTDRMPVVRNALTRYAVSGKF